MESEQSLDQLTTSATISQILSAFEPAAGLLKSIGLDPVNYPEQSLRSVCQQRQWSEDEVLQWLKKQAPSQNGKPEEQDQQKEPDCGNNLTEWCNYLAERYHHPLLELLPAIEKRFPRVKKVHENQYPWLKSVQWRFKKLDDDLRLYLKFQQGKLFPLARKVDQRKKQMLDGTARKLERSLRIIEKDQHRLRQAMDTIREKGKDFRNPEDACSTFRILNQQLIQLEDHLREQFKAEEDYIMPLVRQKIDKG